ncbi:hypothetical protein VI817_008776 [Penicillium citrinum]|nr:hypothetical protein VI817_008776 [Penicillium citrinum]
MKPCRYLPLRHHHPLRSRVSIRRMSFPTSSIQIMRIITSSEPSHYSNNHAYTGSEGEPEDGVAVAASIYTAVIIYAGFFIFCGFQAYLHLRGSRGGAISLQ